MNRRVEKVSAYKIDDFFKVHSGECGWCYCTAWWTESWEGWTERTDEQNKNLRQELFDRGEFDGYLLYLDDIPIGWCQVGRRDRLSKLVSQYNLEANDEIWAITCFVIRPEHRRQGHAEFLLKVILEDLLSQKVKIIQAFPKRTESSEDGEHWRGPEKLFLSCGFNVERDDPDSPLLSIELK